MKIRIKLPNKTTVIGSIFAILLSIGPQIAPGFSQTVVIPDCPSVEDFPKEGAFDEKCKPEDKENSSDEKDTDNSDEEEKES